MLLKTFCVLKLLALSRAHGISRIVGKLDWISHQSGLISLLFTLVIRGCCHLCKHSIKKSQTYINSKQLVLQNFILC